MTRKWTIMVYLAGDNNLSEEMIYAIKEMYRIGVTDQFSVIAQFDPSGIGSPPMRFEIGSPRNDDGVIIGHGQVLSASRGARVKGVNENSADPKTLLDFICSSIKDHPAEHYMVILSGHGNGVEGNFLTDIDPGDIDQDKVVTPPSSLSLMGLKWVFQQVKKANNGKPIDIVGFDSCEMCMGEVASQLVCNVNYIIGAEGTAFNTGWPYHRLLEAFRMGLDTTQPWIDQPGELAKRVVVDYIKYYQDYESTGNSTDQAALDLSKCKDLEEKVNSLAQLLIVGLMVEAGKNPHPLQDGIVLSHWRAQSCGDDDYADLCDFCNLLAGQLRSGPIVGACDEVKKSIEAMVLKSCYSGTAFQHTHGISVYFPWRKNKFLADDQPKPPKGGKMEPNSRYANLDFARDTIWGKFLGLYVDVTRRELRPGAGAVLHIEFPENAFILVRKNFPISRGGDLELNPIKNPPDGFHRCKCEI